MATTLAHSYKTYSRPKWRILALWLVAHISSFLLALLVYWVAQTFIWPNDFTMRSWLAVIAFALALGISQGALLSSFLHQTPRWLWTIVTSLAVLLMSVLVSWLAQRLTQDGYRPGMGYYEFIPLGGAILGSGVGLAQWLILRRATTESYNWLWIPTSILGSVLGSVLLLSPVLYNLTPWFPWFTPLGWVVRLSLCALCAGGVSGPLLLFLIGKRNADSYTPGLDT
jgi:uncharacterized membrane protein YeaQ/YmgE (transglycosylase-associated protein family)